MRSILRMCFMGARMIINGERGVKERPTRGHPGLVFIQLSIVCLAGPSGFLPQTAIDQVTAIKAEPAVGVIWVVRGERVPPQIETSPSSASKRAQSSRPHHLSPALSHILPELLSHNLKRRSWKLFSVLKRCCFAKISRSL